MKRNALPLLAVFALFMLASCARKLSFNNSVVVPAAQGQVKVKKDNNKNYAIEVKVTNLAPPKNLRPARNTYVVWVETKDNGIKSLGQLNSSSGFFSDGLKASLKTVTSYEPKSFFITAEDNGSTQYPGEQVVLRTDNY